MKITVNGEAREVADDYTAATLVEQMGLAGRRIAMEVNREIVPRSRYPQHRFEDGDQVEVVHAIGGGQPAVGELSTGARSATAQV
jgi:thiamine biosynthesis protein ThiS